MSSKVFASDSWNLPPTTEVVDVRGNRMTFAQLRANHENGVYENWEQEMWQGDEKIISDKNTQTIMEDDGIMEQNKPTVWIDPGHGGKDPGAVSPEGRTEKDDNLVFAGVLAAEFIRQGFAVVQTRTDDSTVSLSQRTQIENKNDCALAISAHRNGAVSTDANGVEIWVHSGAGKAICDWAGDMIQGFAALGFRVRGGNYAPGVNRGYRSDPAKNYWINSQTKSPSMLLELGFMGNEGDNMIFDQNLNQMAQAVVKSSCEYLGRPYNQPDYQEPDEFEPDELDDDDREYEQEVAQLKELLQRFEKQREELLNLLDQMKALLG